MSHKKLYALVVSNENKCFQDLKGALKRQGIEVYSPKSCEEVARLLDQAHPELIFTGKLLPDGTWRNIVRLSEDTPAPPNVIVVGENSDIRLYISAMDYGVFDCIFPPFEGDAIVHVVRLTSDSVRRRRESQAMGAVA